MMVFVAYIFEILLQILFVLMLTYVGNFFIKLLFRAVNEKKQDDGNALGRVIGVLERTLMAIGIYCEKWDIVTGVIALKALARFKQLDDKHFAEYFLIGSLGSIIYCLTLVIFYKNYIGFFNPNRLQWFQALI